MKLLCFLMIFFLNIKITQSQSKAGDLAPGALRLDGQKLSCMSAGTAILFKGNGTALIDKNGSFVLPLGKYKIIEHSRGTYGLSLPFGFYEVESKHLLNGGIINSKGRLIYKPSIGNDFTIVKNIEVTEKICVILENTYSKEGTITQKTLLLFYDGKTVNLGTMDVSNISDGMIQFKDRSTGKYGYADTTGRILIQPRFYRSYKFSEGLAAAAVQDDNSRFAWGFIDKAGNFVITPRFLWDPSDFSMGLAAFCNKGRKYGEGGFINHRGDTVINLAKATNFIFDFQRRSGDFHGDYFIHSYPIVKLDGTFITPEKLLATFNLDTGTVITPNCYEDQVILHDVKRNYGMLLLKDHLVIPPIFSLLTVFDKTSALAYAELTLEKIDNNEGYRRGLINRHGQFVIYIDTRY